MKFLLMLLFESKTMKKFLSAINIQNRFINASLKKILNLIGMRLRRVMLSRIVLPLIKSTKVGINLNADQLESDYLVE